MGTVHSPSPQPAGTEGSPRAPPPMPFAASRLPISMPWFLSRHPVVPCGGSPGGPRELFCAPLPHKCVFACPLWHGSGALLGMLAHTVKSEDLGGAGSQASRRGCEARERKESAHLESGAWAASGSHSISLSSLGDISTWDTNMQGCDLREGSLQGPSHPVGRPFPGGQSRQRGWPPPPSQAPLVKPRPRCRLLACGPGDFQGCWQRGVA